MFGTLANYVGWAYVPNLATKQLLPYFHKGYQLVYRRPPPPPNTKEYQTHYRIVYATVVASYLLYNFYGAATSMDANYYEILRVEPTADDNALKAAFRQFARKYHPDRVGPSGERLFMSVRDAYEALKSPAKRFAYDRFGPDALQWTHCTTLREYIRHGLMQSTGFYIVSACILLLLSAASSPSPVAYWRYILLLSLWTYELLYILDPSPTISSPPSITAPFFPNPASPTHATLLTYLWPRRVAYQHIRLLHSLFVFCSLALSNVVPVVFPTDSPATKAHLVRNEALGIAALSSALAREASVMTRTLVHSIRGPRSDATFPLIPPHGDGPPVPDDAMARLELEMRNLLIETQLHADGGPIRSAVEIAVRNRRAPVAFPAAGEEAARPWRSPLPRRTTSYVRARSISLG